MRKGAVLANIVLAVAAVLCVFALVYFFYFYTWTGQRQFTSSAGMLLYYVCPTLVAIFLFGSLWLPSPRKINLALLLISSGACIYSLEILLTIWFNLPSVISDQGRKFRTKAAKAEGVVLDSRSKRQVIEDFRKQGIDAVPALPAWHGGHRAIVSDRKRSAVRDNDTLLELQKDGIMKSRVEINGTEVLPLTGVANKLTVLCNEGGDYITYYSDRHGFNNPQDVWDKSPADVVAVGDSFTQGWCVTPNKNFVALIRQRYPATINLGIEGSGPLVALAAIKEYAQSLKPKVVLWFYYEDNDLSDLDNERRSALLLAYMTKGFSQHLSSRQPEIDRALTDYIQTEYIQTEIQTTKENDWLLTKIDELAELLTHPSQLPNGVRGILMLGELRPRLGLVQGRQVKSLLPPPSIDKRAESVIPLVNLLHDVLVEAKTMISGWGGKLYFVFLPQWQRYVPGGEPNPDRDRVLEAAKKAELRIVDIHEAFLRQPDPAGLFPFRLGGHYNERGHQVVAEEVLRSISLRTKITSQNRGHDIVTEENKVVELQKTEICLHGRKTTSVGGGSPACRL